MLDLRREEKQEKLLQYAERVWHINSGTNKQRLDMAINNTRNFFEQLGRKTQLSAYNIGSKDIQPLLDPLEVHGMVTLGEHDTVNLAMSRKVLEASL